MNNSSALLLEVREPPGQAMAIARSCCRRRVLQRLHKLHAVLPCHRTHSPLSRGPPFQYRNNPSHCKFISYFVPVRSGRSVILNRMN